ncbi:unnamed protein product [Bemisia tabaci]|uniref:Uncharacterized protein n=1 Tax=Bemisia tabaci TaxID=7038 RepID=A0A9P0F031_BEMTA|nr:unnamed protein product [Bemisia tabaci]
MNCEQQSFEHIHAWLNSQSGDGSTFSESSTNIHEEPSFILGSDAAEEEEERRRRKTKNGWGSKKDVLKDLQVCSDFTTDEPQAHLLERTKEPSEPDYEEHKESWNNFDHIQNLFQTKTAKAWAQPAPPPARGRARGRGRLLEDTPELLEQIGAKKFQNEGIEKYVRANEKVIESDSSSIESNDYEDAEDPDDPAPSKVGDGIPSKGKSIPGKARVLKGQAAAGLVAKPKSSKPAKKQDNVYVPPHKRIPEDPTPSVREKMASEEPSKTIITTEQKNKLFNITSKSKPISVVARRNPLVLNLVKKCKDQGDVSDEDQEEKSVEEELSPPNTLTKKLLDDVTKKDPYFNNRHLDVDVLCSKLTDLKKAENNSPDSCLNFSSSSEAELAMDEYSSGFSDNDYTYQNTRASNALKVTTITAEEDEEEDSCALGVRSAYKPSDYGVDGYRYTTARKAKTPPRTFIMKQEDFPSL